MLFHDLLRYVPLHVVSSIFGVLTLLATTKLFSASDYGDYTLVRTCMLLAATATAWIDASTIRFYATYQDKQDKAVFLSTVLWIRVTLVSGILAVGLVCLFMFRGHLHVHLLMLAYWGLAAAVCSAVFGGINLLFRANRNINVFSYFAIWSISAGWCLAMVLIVSTGMGIVAFLVGSVAAIVIALPMLWKRSELNAGHLLSAPSLRLARECSRYGLPIAIGSLAAWVLNASDKLVIGHLCANEAVGFYGASYRLSEQSYGLFLSLFYMADRPMAMQVWAQERERGLQVFLNRATKLYLRLGLPAAAMLCAMAPTLLPLVTDERYRDGFMIFPYVIAANVFIGLALRFQVTSLCHNATKTIVGFTIMAGGLNIVLNYALIPYYGFQVAGVTTLLAAMIYTACNVLYSIRIMTFTFPVLTALRVGIASCAAFACARLVMAPITALWLQLMTGSLTSILVFVCGAVLLREFRACDIRHRIATVCDAIMNGER